jgi:hypothetical protein
VRAAWFAVPVAVLVAGAGVVALVRDTGGGAPAGVAAHWQERPDGSRFLPEASLPRLPYRSVIAGDGSHALLTGSVLTGRKTFENPSFVFDVRRSDLTAAPPLPFAPGLSTVHAVGIPGGAVVVGTRCASGATDGGDFSRPECAPGDLVGARFDFGTGRWTVLHPPQVPGFTPGNGGETGRAVGWDGRAAVFEVGAPGAVIAYDPASDRWTRAPYPDTANLLSPVLCAAGAGVDAMSLVPPDVMPAEGTGKAYAKGALVWHLAPAATTWQALPDPSFASHDPRVDGLANFFQIVCGPDGFLLSTPGLDQMRAWSDATQTWSDVPDAPFARTVTGPDGRLQVVDFPSARTIGGEYVFSGAAHPVRSGLAYDPVPRRWRETTPGPGFGTGVDDVAVLGGHGYFLTATGPGRLGIGEWAPRPFDGVLQEPPLGTTVTTAPVAPQ